MKFSRPKIIGLLLSFFPNLDEDDIKLFLSITEYNYASNKTVLLKGNKKDKNMILVLKGAARAFKIDEEGKEQNNFIRADGKLIADANVFGDGPQLLTVESMSDIHYLKFDISVLENIGLNNHRLMTFYLNFLKEIIVTLSHRLDTFVSLSNKERYLDLIKWNPLYLESTYDKHIASFLGMTVLTLHRIKKDLTHIK